MNQSIVAVVVTFNRKNLLLKCLQSLLNQTIPISKIIVIDNASTDGTEEYLADLDIVGLNKLVYKRLSANTGGSGGFNEGLSEALKYEADWFWLMDDDVTANSQCLEKLMEFCEVSECLHPRKILPNGIPYRWEHNIDIQSCNKMQMGDISFRNGKLITFTNVGCFEGMLVSRKVVEAIGLPDKKYFIGEDDTLYGLMASAYTNVSYVKNAVMHKLLPLNTDAPWRSYYTIRNKFYLRKDELAFFEFKSSRANYIFFALNRLIEIIRIVNNGGSKYLKPCILGLIDGLNYTHFNKIK
jgi:GT2 family glycosyltransferase